MHIDNRNFLFRLPNVKMLDKKRIFSVKNKQKGTYVKKQILVYKCLIQFFYKVTYNSFLHDKVTSKKFIYVNGQRSTK